MTTTTIPQGTLVTTLDQQMHVIDVGAGDPVVFLHGGGPGADGWVDFGPVLPYFQDRRCILPDLIQYGKSNLPHHNEPTWSYHARYVNAMMEAIGLDRADFVCSSVGGTVALALAIEYPSRVGRIVCSGSQPTFEVPGRALGDLHPGQVMVAKYYADGGPTWQKARDLMAEVEWYDPAGVPDATVDIRFANTMRPEWLELWAAPPDARGSRQDLSEHLGKVANPVLLLWGKQEVILQPSYALFLSTLLPNCELYLMDRTRHHPEEERPADYSAIVRAFLARTDPV